MTENPRVRRFIFAFSRVIEIEGGGWGHSLRSVEGISRVFAVVGVVLDKCLHSPRT